MSLSADLPIVTPSGVMRKRDPLLAPRAIISMDFSDLDPRIAAITSRSSTGNQAIISSSLLDGELLTSRRFRWRVVVSSFFGASATISLPPDRQPKGDSRGRNSFGQAVISAYSRAVRSSAGSPITSILASQPWPYGSAFMVSGESESD
jgi:hypothetical protein